jgi:hypothetical protein
LYQPAWFQPIAVADQSTTDAKPAHAGTPRIRVQLKILDPCRCAVIKLLREA